MARYASMCQTANIVPIVEPEVLYDGSHNISQSREVTGQVVKLLVQMLKAYRVDFSGCILKTSMVLAGKTSGNDSTPQEVAENTLSMLHEAVPETMAGIVFLSGGQATEQARANLQAIGASGKQPWPITFSFSRAVQDLPMKAWAGKSENVAEAQKIYFGLTKACAEARHGEYQPSSSDANDGFVSASQDS
jgi:fructose-bisphosphate aldolase class I